MNFLVEIITLSILILSLCALSLPLLQLMNRHQLHSIDAKRWVILVFLVVIGIHTLISLWNGFAGPLFGAGIDAYQFHLAALNQTTVTNPSEWKDSSEVDLYRLGWYYALFLKGVYAITTESWAIGGMVSTLAFGFLCVVCVQIYYLFQTMAINIGIRSPSKDAYFLTLIITSVGLLPTVLLLTSYTLREVFQMLFLASAVLTTLKFYHDRHLVNLLITVVSIALFSTLHNSFIIYSVLYLISIVILLANQTIIFWLKKYKPIHYWSAIIAILTSLIMAFQQLYHDEFVYFLKRASAFDNARAFYGIADFSDNTLTVFTYMIVSIFNYFVRPFPWEVSSWVDTVTIAENIFRFYIWFKLWYLRKYLTAPMIWLLSCLLMLECLWSLGTVNWGTAQRHHIVVWPLLVVTYFSLKAIVLTQKISSNDTGKSHISLT